MTENTSGGIGPTLGCVFVVDDESLVGMGLKQMLERLGVPRVELFSSAESALEKLQEYAPDVVFMDIKLGSGMDGLAAAREVMERRPCPVIITSAYAEEPFLRAAMESHVFGYLVKPVVTKQLTSALVLAKTRFEEFRRLQGENDDLRIALETRKLVERAKGILMEKKRLSEPQAYQIMRSQSQQQSRSMREIAENIIRAAEFL